MRAEVLGPVLGSPIQEWHGCPGARFSQGSLSDIWEAERAASILASSKEKNVIADKVVKSPWHEKNPSSFGEEKSNTASWIWLFS